MAEKREYVLKPGKHQFAVGSPAIHDNDNTSDEECAWYLSKFPHIKSLFEKIPKLAPAGKKSIEVPAIVQDEISDKETITQAE